MDNLNTNRRYVYSPIKGEPVFLISTDRKSALQQIASHMDRFESSPNKIEKKVKKRNKNHIITRVIINKKGAITGYYILKEKEVNLVDITDHVSLNMRLIHLLGTENRYLTFDEIKSSLREDSKILKDSIAFSLSMGEIVMGYTLSPEILNELKIHELDVCENLGPVLDLIKETRFSLGDISVLFKIGRSA